MLAVVQSSALRGVEAFSVSVEVNVSQGLPGFSVVGLPQGVVREGRERVLTALANAGYRLPPRKITVNLAPAEERKDGSALDLPLAVGLLEAQGVLPAGASRGRGFLGELGLDGEVRPVRGAVAAAEALARMGLEELVLPLDNVPEAALVRGLRIRGARHLREVVDHLRGPGSGLGPIRAPAPPGAGDRVDWTDSVLSRVRGQPVALRALEIAAAGGHNLLLEGPPGAGKTLLARGLVELLPPLSPGERLEVARVFSAAGALAPGDLEGLRRPFRAPHHTVSHVGLLGGGPRLSPGEVTLAHCGVLFLDELPEFSRRALESLRQPLEAGEVQVTRAQGRVRFPARFALVAAMNPCPCGYHGEEDGPRECRCDPGAAHRYRSRVSGPLRDRFDLRLRVSGVPADTLLDPGPAGEDLREVARRIRSARDRQRERDSRGAGVESNAQAPPPAASELPARARDALRAAAVALGISARGCHRILRVARTISDLAGEDAVSREAVLEAVQFRGEEATG